MRGYAPTEIPRDGDYRMATLAADAAALVEALGDKGAILVGHDWGAAAAFGAANLRPDLVRQLITVAIPHPASLRLTPVLLWKARHFVTLQLPGAAHRLRANGFAQVDELVRRWSPAWDVPPGETDAVKRALSQPGCVEAAIGYYRAAGVRVPKLQRGRIRMPSVAFAGETDPVVTPAAYELARRLYVDAYEVVTLPGGHFLHREHPDRFADALVSRLRSA
jgi:pimeloyl-ACP methyl ester carboxylesterase